MSQEVLGLILGAAWAPEIMENAPKMQKFFVEARKVIFEPTHTISLIELLKICSGPAMSFFIMIFMLRGQKNQHNERMKNLDKQISIITHRDKIYKLKKNAVMASKNICHNIDTTYNGKGIEIMKDNDNQKSNFIMEWFVTDFQESHNKHQAFFLYRFFDPSDKYTIKEFAEQNEWWTNGFIISLVDNESSMIEIVNDATNESNKSISINTNSEFPSMENGDYETILILLQIIQMRHYDRLVFCQQKLNEIYKGKPSCVDRVASRMRNFVKHI